MNTDSSSPSKGKTGFFEGLRRFFTEEPEDHPIGETLAATVQQPSALIEHVTALRKHLTRMLIAVVIGIGICAAFTNQLIAFLAAPIGGIGMLQAIDPTETIGVFMKVALWGGFSIAVPYIAFELWLFAAPGLSARTRRSSLLAIPFTLVFFIGSMVFAYFIMLPTALPFLMHFMNVQTVPRISSYTNFVTSLLFWIGVAFEFPLVIYVLSIMGFVKPQMLVKQWRIAIILMAVLAAAITPTTDPVNMSLVMAPMIILYFLSILLSRMAVAGRQRRQAEAA